MGLPCAGVARLRMVLFLTRKKKKPSVAEIKVFSPFAHYGGNKRTAVTPLKKNSGIFGTYINRKEDGVPSPLKKKEKQATPVITSCRLES